MQEENLQEIKNQFLLIDTNVIIDASKNAKEFSSFFEKILKYEVKPLLDLTIQLEFVRGARSLEEADKHQEFINKLLGGSSSPMQLSNDIYRLAKEISIVLNKSSTLVKPMKLGDCLIAAHIAKFSKESSMARVYLATQNHQDFSPILFKQVFLYPIRLADGKIKLIGIYKFDNLAFETLLKI